MIPDNEIGGAYVRRTFTRNGEYLRPGTVLSGDDVRSFNLPNMRALIDSGYLEAWPKPPVDNLGDRSIVHIGGGRYDVYAGKLNAEPLNREDAEELATRP